MAKAANLTNEEILDVAQHLIQVHGWHGFSFRDIADALGIKSSSLHYHFPKKADLGVAVVKRYSERRRDELRILAETKKSPAEKLKAFSGVFHALLADGRVCLCGFLAVERRSIPPEVKAEVDVFFQLNITWLSDLLERARKDGVFSFSESATARARAIFSILEGAMIILDGEKATQQLNGLVRSVLADLTG